MLCEDVCTLVDRVVKGKVGDDPVFEDLATVLPASVDDLCVLNARAVEDTVDDGLAFEDLTVVASTSVLREDLCTLVDKVVKSKADDDSVLE